MPKFDSCVQLRFWRRYPSRPCFPRSFLPKISNIARLSYNTNPLLDADPTVAQSSGCTILVPLSSEYSRQHHSRTSSSLALSQPRRPAAALSGTSRIFILSATTTLYYWGPVFRFMETRTVALRASTRAPYVRLHPCVFGEPEDPGKAASRRTDRN